MPVKIETKIKQFKKVQEKLLMMKEEIHSQIKYHLYTKNDVISFIEAEVPLDQECMYCVFLNSKNTIITYERMTAGAMTQCLCYPRHILSKAIEVGALSIILVHNHPSGSIQPSSNDVKATKKMLFSGRAMDISLLDHIIIGAGERYSFLDEGIIEQFNNEFNMLMEVA